MLMINKIMRKFVAISFHSSQSYHLLTSIILPIRFKTLNFHGIEERFNYAMYGLTQDTLSQFNSI